MKTELSQPTANTSLNDDLLQKLQEENKILKEKVYGLLSSITPEEFHLFFQEIFQRGKEAKTKLDAKMTEWRKEGTVC